MSVYDPCSGSGGMLILAKEYVEEHGGDPRNLRLAGQEYNGSVWSMSKMNMLLHGIPDADMQNGDTLAEPMHVHGGRWTASTGCSPTRRSPWTTPATACSTRTVPVGLGARGRQEGRPDVRPAHALGPARAAGGSRLP